jgi:hypothetical protein
VKVRVTLKNSSGIIAMDSSDRNFTITHNNIPEFPSVVIFPTVMLIALFIIIKTRKKKRRSLDDWQPIGDG